MTKDIKRIQAKIERIKQTAQSEPSEYEISYTLAMQPIWMAQNAMEVINYLFEENKKLKEQLNEIKRDD